MRATGSVGSSRVANRQQINTKPRQPSNQQAPTASPAKHAQTPPATATASDPRALPSLSPPSSVAAVLAAPSPDARPAPSGQLPARIARGRAAARAVRTAVSARPYHAIYASLPSCLWFPRVSATTCSLLDSSVLPARRRHLTIVPQAMCSSSRARAIRTARPPSCACSVATSPIVVTSRRCGRRRRRQPSALCLRMKRKAHMSSFARVCFSPKREIVLPSPTLCQMSPPHGLII